MARVLVPLADGFEELEAITVIDLLRRAEIEVVTAGRSDTVCGAHGVSFNCDATMDDALAQDWDMAALPGGLPGADNLAADAALGELLKQMNESDKFTAAICAAPKVLAAAGLLDGLIVTSYPGSLDGIAIADAIVTQDTVVKDGKVITSRGPGTAMDFALALIEALVGKARRDAVEDDLQRPQPFESGPAGLMGLVEFNRILDREHRRCTRYARAFTLMVVQVVSGEHAGMQMEHMMRNVASKLGSMIRDSDAISLRSETFLILATETDRQGAIDMGKRLRKGLKGLTDNAELIIGSASYPEDAVEMYQLIGMAEEAIRA
jgi:protein deglycase